MDIFETDIVPVRPFGLSLACLRTSHSSVLEHIHGMEYERALSVEGADVMVRTRRPPDIIGRMFGLERGVREWYKRGHQT